MLQVYKKSKILAIVLCVCVLSVPVLADSHDTIERVFDTRPGGRLGIDTDLGSITVRTGAPDEVRIVITRIFPSGDRGVIEDILDNLDIDMDADDRGVTIETRYRYRPRWSLFSFGNSHDRLRLRYEIVVPETYDVDLITRDDDITVAGLTGSVRSVTSDGDIVIRSIDGPVVVKTSDGDIDMVSITGEVDAQTSDGDVEIEEVHAEVRARTSDGDITISHIGGQAGLKTSDGNIHAEDVAGPIQCTTSDGNIRAENIAGSADCVASDGNIDVILTGHVRENCRFRTSDGDISVVVDKDSEFSIDAHSSDGGIDFDQMTVRLGRADRHNLVADMNGGGPELEMRTSDGTIRIRAK